MLLYSTLAAASLACLNTSNEQIVANVGHLQNAINVDLGHDRLEDQLYRSASDASLSSKWQRERQLKEEMMTGIAICLTTRNRSMEKSKQRALHKTDWFTAWDTHCSNQIDLNCPIKAGECWAMGVITCRKNCDAKFLLRGNRGKFKRCIYKQMKVYEKLNPDTVVDQCSVFAGPNSFQ